MSIGTVVEGSVKEIGEVQTFGDFSKRQLVVQTGGEYPQVLPIDFYKERAEWLDGLKQGTKVRVNVDVRGRQSGAGRYFVDLLGWKIQELQ